MRQRGLWIILVVILTGCSEKNRQPVSPDTTCTLLLDQAALSVLTSTGDAPPALPEDTEIGVYAIDRETGTFDTGDRCRNVVYQVTDNAGTLSSPLPALLEKEHSYDIFAYAPVHAVQPEEQKQDASLSVGHGEDILYASPVSLIRVSENNRAVSLQFSHRMAQVQFFLEPESGLGEKYLKGAAFRISGFYENAGLSLSSGALTVRPGNGAEINSLPEQLQTPAVCVIPPSASQTLTITLTTDAKREQTKTFDFRFEPGKSYQFTIKYTSALNLEITSSVILWKDFNGGDIQIGGD